MRPSVPGRRMLPDLPGLDTDAGPQKPGRMMDKSVDRLVDLLVDDIADGEVAKAANLPSLAHQSPYLLPVPTPSLISPYDETTRLRREVQRIKAVCERKLAAAEEEKLVALRQQHAEMTAATNEALVAMKQREQDELAEQLFKQAGRRLLSQGLTAGWLCWVQFIEARRYARSRLDHLRRSRNLAGRLHMPTIGRAWAKWAEIASRQATLYRQEALKSALEDRVGSLETQLREAEEARRTALERQLIELTGSAEDRAALAVEKEKETRVELLRVMFARRLLNIQVANGFAAWWEYWEARYTAKERLRRSANRLHSPAVAHAFSFWLDLVSEIHQQRALAALEAEGKTLEGQLRRARFEAGQLELRKTSLEEELSGLQVKARALEKAAAEKETALATAAAVSSENERLLLAVAEAEAEAEAAETKLADLTLMDGRTREANNELLERLLAEQRSKLDDEIRLFREKEWSRAEAEAKEARVELLRRSAIRRLMAQHLIRGWTQWHDECARVNDLRWKASEGAARLQRAWKAQGFSCWLRSAGSSREDAIRAEARRGIPALEKELQDARASILSLGSERHALLEQVAFLSNGEEVDVDRLIASQKEQAKAERLESLRQRSLRRMMASGLAVGWVAWYELYTARKGALAKLRRSSQKLRRPHLAAGFALWVAVWSEAHHRAELKAADERERGLSATSSGLAEELQALKTQLEAQQGAAEADKRRALERQRVELVGSHSERAAMRQKLDKEERVELLRRQVLRRVMNASMTRGWSAWTELYEAKTYSLNKLRECGNKLHAPDVAGAFVEWLAVVEEEKANKAEELIKMEAKSLEVQLRHSRFEAGQLDILRVAHEDELRALKDKVGRLVATGKEQAATIDEHRGLADELAALHKLHTLKVEEAAASDRERAAAEEAIMTQRAEQTALIQRLLEKQRRSLDEESEGMSGRMAATVQEKEDVERELGKQREAANVLQSELEAEKAALASKRAEGERLTLLVAEKGTEAASARADESRVRSELEAAAERYAALEAKIQAAEERYSTLQEELDATRDQLIALQKAKSPSPTADNEKKHHNKTSILGKIDLDEGPGALEISEQIAIALKGHASRVLDLFREWDTNGDGEISKKEFRKAMVSLGLQVPVKDVDALFDKWDGDGGGCIQYKELNRILRKA